MRKLILWLCRTFDVWPITEARLHMGPDKVARSQRWEGFATEEGGLFDMIDTLRREAFEAYSAQPPSAHAERDYLAMTDRNLRALRQRVDAIIATGKIEARNAAAKDRARVLKSV